MASPSSLIPTVGPDGLAMDPPVIAYTEKVLEEKELEIKKYIEDNYSKIRNVERELASLTFEIKMTAGPKKAALEHLRKKIELCAEKIKVAKQKEEQAKKVWEVAAKALKEEEDKKQVLCDDLNRLVQETAALQYSRLEELKQKLEAVTCGPIRSSAASALLPTEGKLQQSLSSEESKSNAVATQITVKSTDTSRDKPVAEKESQKVGLKSEEKPSNPNPLESRNRPNVNRTSNNSKSRGTILRGNSGQKLKGNNWTGAGFDVDDNAINS